MWRLLSVFYTMAITLSRHVRVFVHATFERSSPVTKLREGSPIGHVYRCDRVIHTADEAKRHEHRSQTTVVL